MKLKKIICFALAAVICLSLCACAEKEAAPLETPVPSEAPAVETPVVEPSPEAEAPANDLKSIATEYIGKEVSELFEVIGMPLESAYAPSCLGDGEDGEHHYDGFIVYTYKEGESEIVQVVL